MNGPSLFGVYIISKELPHEITYPPIAESA